mmetsp:Transcript_48661/g.155720  ORF Transcript_48661/g.155720 Transcript_48661/m.155720 type:complete len:129 (-) Transcript_48661:1107-1493(-)
MAKIWLPNLVMKLLPTSTKFSGEPAMIKQIAFRVTPKTTKPDIKEHLQKLYGLDIERVDTVNIEGKKKRVGQKFFRRPDWKKAYVYLREPVPVPASFKSYLDTLEADAKKAEAAKAEKAGKGVPKGIP